MLTLLYWGCTTTVQHWYNIVGQLILLVPLAGRKQSESYMLLVTSTSQNKLVTKITWKLFTSISACKNEEGCSACTFWLKYMQASTENRDVAELCLLINLLTSRKNRAGKNTQQSPEEGIWRRLFTAGQTARSLGGGGRDGEGGRGGFSGGPPPVGTPREMFYMSTACSGVQAGYERADRAAQPGRQTASPGDISLAPWRVQHRHRCRLGRLSAPNNRTKHAKNGGNRSLRTGSKFLTNQTRFPDLARVDFALWRPYNVARQDCLARVESALGRIGDNFAALEAENTTRSQPTNSRLAAITPPLHRGSSRSLPPETRLFQQPPAGSAPQTKV
ncbi:hypothetical protein Bbelb_334950 [Branchiostoma belcheri]|nr:hypothetical protein Bbelb_334950 [Branchiostoma belcheri]